MKKNTLSILASLVLAAGLNGESKPAEQLASRMQARSNGERLQGYRDAAIGMAQMTSAMTEQEKTPQKSVTVVSTDRLIPLVLQGPSGVYSIATEIMLVNTYTRAASVTIEFFDSYGDRVAVPMLGSDGRFDDSYEMMGGAIGAKGATGIVTYPFGKSLQLAYARVKSSPAGVVEVAITHDLINGDFLASATSVGTRNNNSEYYFWVQNDAGEQVNLTLLNAANSTANLNIRARSAGGVELCRITGYLNASRVSQLRLWRDDACFRSIRGSYLVEVTSDRLGLVTGAFAPTDSGFVILTPVPGDVH